MSKNIEQIIHERFCKKVKVTAVEHPNHYEIRVKVGKIVMAQVVAKDFFERSEQWIDVGSKTLTDQIWNKFVDEIDAKKESKAKIEREK